MDRSNNTPVTCKKGALTPANPLVQGFSTRFRTWRASNDHTLSDVAEAVKVSASTVHAWELGTRFPSVDNLHTPCQYTGTPAQRFLAPLKGPPRRYG